MCDGGRHELPPYDDRGGGTRDERQHFIRSLLEGCLIEAPAPNLDEAVKTMELAQAILRRAKGRVGVVGTIRATPPPSSVPTPWNWDTCLRYPPTRFRNSYCGNGNGRAATGGLPDRIPRRQLALTVAGFAFPEVT